MESTKYNKLGDRSLGAKRVEVKGKKVVKDPTKKTDQVNDWLMKKECDCYAHLVKMDRDSKSNAPTLIHLYKKNTVLGRSSQCDVVFDSLIHPMSISRTHAKLEITEEGIVIRDSSTNGVFVNNEKVNFRILKDGDIITLAGGKGIQNGKHFEQPNSPFKFQYVVLKKGKRPSALLENTSELLTSTSETCLDTVSEEYYSMNLRADTVKGNCTCSMCKKLFVVPITLNCGHTFCYTCDLQHAMRNGNKYECPICFERANIRCRSIVIESVVQNLLKSEGKMEGVLFEERQKFARMYLLNTDTIYGDISVKKLPYGMKKWTPEQTIEVNNLMKKVSGIERENWFVALGITKYDLIRTSPEEVITVLDNLNIEYFEEDDEKTKLALVFAYINN
ncbi:hypothetical protein EIN_030890 [Entamoeba invadens IP1]|uniref:FHA domain containing protein n=1 Tax=Entamoeba invadens IP1 TaxID=370355 RepID=A0A0A1U1D4_ENTIV|nr:hypothetical protein EIN_030890 [Entamoeba invadens IP1]ELP86408.1 hypothetical protein EIN_030890 [Entamoeba invadens IP1]|eukprot:XP_004185754.1 hypothetical protein EIN_030890 [Entamoeba invadens IP1]